MITLEVLIFTPSANEYIFEKFETWFGKLNPQNLGIGHAILFRNDSATAQSVGVSPIGNTVVFIDQNTNRVLGRMVGNEINQANVNTAIANLDQLELTGNGEIFDNNSNSIIPLGTEIGFGFGFQLPKFAWGLIGAISTYKAIDSQTILGQAGFGAGAAYSWKKYLE